MKSKLSILLFFLCLNVFGQVPNTTTFTFWEVCVVLYGSYSADMNLSQAFIDADDAKFDALYKGDKTNLLNFRNYGAITPGTYDDWSLPTIAQLVRMHENLYDYSVGGFTDANYWSSYNWNGGGGSYSTVVMISTGNTSTANANDDYHRVRAIRIFITTNSGYNLRDEGPAGGWISYKQNLYGNVYVYEETEPTDLSSSSNWFNARDACNALIIYH